MQLQLLAACNTLLYMTFLFWPAKAAGAAPQEACMQSVPYHALLACLIQGLTTQYLAVQFLGYQLLLPGTHAVVPFPHCFAMPY